MTRLFKLTISNKTNRQNISESHISKREVIMFSFFFTMQKDSNNIVFGDKKRSLLFFI